MARDEGARAGSAAGLRARVRGGLVVALLAFACTLPGSPPAEPRPPVLLVTLDTTRLDHVGAYGTGDTPHLEAFAATGMRFDAAYTTIPTTAPAHASLFTGQHPYEHGVRKNGQRLDPENARLRGLPLLLQQRGYATAAVTTSGGMGSPPLDLPGFDHVDVARPGLRKGADAVEAALAWLETHTDDRPVFLWVHIFDSHSPYGSYAEKEDAFPVDKSRYGWLDPEDYPAAAERREMADMYRRGVRAADTAFGTILRGWRERFGADGVVIAFADHGEFLDEHLDQIGFAYGHGALLGPEVLHIPLIVAGDGVGVGVSTAPVSIRDLYTTILGVAGREDPTAVAEGRRDLRATEDPARTVFAERREITESYWEKRGSAPVVEVERFRVAAVSREGMIVVGQDGEPLDRAPSTELLGLARAHLAHVEASDAGGLKVDEDVMKQLESLGYVY